MAYLVAYSRAVFGAPYAGKWRVTGPSSWVPYPQLVHIHRCGDGSGDPDLKFVHHVVHSPSLDFHFNVKQRKPTQPFGANHGSF